MSSKESPFPVPDHIQHTLNSIDRSVTENILFLSNKRQQMGRRGLSMRAKNNLIRKVESDKRLAEQIRGEFAMQPVYESVREKLVVPVQ